MSEPVSIDPEALLFLREASSATHGGSPGIREEGLLDSALARRRNRWPYESPADMAELAASYGFGPAMNHPFPDGNERAAFHAPGLLLVLHGLRLEAGQVDAVRVMLRLAAGQMAEGEFAVWLRANIVAPP